MDSRWRSASGRGSAAAVYGTAAGTGSREACVRAAPPRKNKGAALDTFYRVFKFSILELRTMYS